MSELAIICGRVGGDVTVVSGSDTRTCERCQNPVWAAPSSLKVLKENASVSILCMQCALPEILKAKREEMMLATGAEEETNRHFQMLGQTPPSREDLDAVLSNAAELIKEKYGL